MARTKRRQDLNKVGGQDTLMPVSPKDQTAKKGLSRDGETEEAQEDETKKEESMSDSRPV